MANPNPSPETRFGGVRANPSGKGKTSAQQLADIQSARKAAIIRNKVLSEVLEKIKAGADPIELLSSDIRNVMKDSEDRAHGTPKATVESDMNLRGEVEFTKIERTLVSPKDTDSSGI